MGIDLRDEGRLAAERDRCLEKLDPLAFEIADRGVGDCRDSSRRLRARRTGQVAQDGAFGFGRGRRGQAKARYVVALPADRGDPRSEEHTSELQSLMRNSYAVL